MMIALTLVVGVVPKAGADPADPGQPDPTTSAPSDPTTPPADDVTPPADDTTPPIDDATPQVQPTSNTAKLPNGATINWSALPTTATPSSTGYVPIPWDTSAIDDGTYTSTSPTNRAAALPPFYNVPTNYMSGVRDQGGWGTCWAFAASEAAESALVRTGVLNSSMAVTSRQLSPLHLVQGVYNTNTFTANTDPYSHYNAYQIGGNDLVAAAAWSHFYGAQTEAAYPYPLAQSKATPPTLPSPLTSAQLQSSVYHLKSMYLLPSPYNSSNKYSATNVNTIKNAVYTYGAVTTAYAGSKMNTSYYRSNGSYSSFYDPYRDDADHAVLIIGWDDTFPASNFTYTPAGPGAFKIQNSWGAGTANDDYFWLSYYDRSIDGGGVYDMVKATASNPNYQSPTDWTKQYSWDAIGSAGWFNLSSKSITYSNKFTASEDSALRAAQIVTQQPNMKYKIQVYVGSIKSNSPVTGGSAKALKASGSKSVSGTLTYAGYNTITFSRPVALKAGQKYSIVLTLTAPSGYAKASVEAKFDWGGGYAKLSISSGQSYVKYRNKWYDFTTVYKSKYGMKGWFGNANIIGLTSPKPTNVLTLDTNATGVTVSPASLTVTFNSKIGAIPTPVRTGYTFKGWYTATSGGSKYTSTTVVTFVGDKTLYARWKAKTYTAKFSANGGVTPTKSGKAYKSKTVTFGKTYGALPTTKRTGYTFAGWFTDKIAGTQVTSTTPVNTIGTRTLYAHWTPKTYTVKFNPNKGALGPLDPTSEVVTYGQAYGPLPQPTRDNYTFVGWYTKTSGGSKITELSTVKITATTTLYARWKAIA